MHSSRMRTGRSFTVWGWCIVPGGGVPGPRGCMVPGGCLVLWGGGGIPACTEADPPCEQITHTSKNITLATTSLRPVKKLNCMLQ